MSVKPEFLLSIDCSLRLAGVALSEGERVLASEALDLGRRQAAELPLMVERLLRDANRSFHDVSLLAVTNGPGYFTGIRVGVSYAMGLAYGLGVSIVPVSSLKMLAAGQNLDGKGVLAMVYAGQGAVYAASFGVEEGPLAQGEYAGAEIAAWMKEHEGVTAISDDPGRVTLGVDLGEIRTVRPDPARLAEAAWAKRDSAISPMELRVAYCRAPSVI